jgi:hypothetical protein
MRERDGLPGAGRRRGGAAGDLRGADHGRQDRARIAHAAARLIVEHGLNDWALAKRKAARQLMLPDSTPYPSNDEIESALTDYQALFGGDAHLRTLRAQRQRAREWMQRLAAWAPLLVGGVAAGWASAHSDVRIELAADDPKAVALFLAGRGIDYQASGGQRPDGATVLLIDERDVAVRLEILTPNDRRHRSRQDSAVRLDLAAVAALLEAPG